MKHKIRLIIVFLLFSLTASPQSVTEKFIGYLNSYNSKALAKITTPDFKITRTFSGEVTNRNTFLGKYLKDSEALTAKYKVVALPNGKDRNYYLVLDQSQYLKFLGVKFPTFKVKFKTSKGKLSQFTLEPTEDYDAYREELESKAAAFQSWLTENQPNVKDAELDDIPTLLSYLYDYVQSQNIGLWELQQYDDGMQSEPLSEAEEIKLDQSLRCVYKAKYKKEERMQFYPWNKAKKVFVISFDDPSAAADYQSKTNKLPDLSVAKSVKELNPNRVDFLNDLIFNTSFAGPHSIVVEELRPCPALKNAIVFADERGEPFEYIEIFFGCGQVELSSDKVSFGDNCTNKMAVIKDFFSFEEIQTGQ